MKIITTIRVEEELIEELKKIASREDRSVNYIIQNIIKEYLKVKCDE